MLYLGFRICSRSLTVTWPYYKRDELYHKIMAALGLKRPWFKPKGVASIIGKLRSASLIAPWGPYLSFSLAIALNQAVRSAYEAIRRWWQRGRVWISKSIQQELHMVARTTHGSRAAFRTRVQPALEPLHRTIGSKGSHPHYSFRRELCGHRWLVAGFPNPMAHNTRGLSSAGFQNETY
jgi:hypothetical protein